MQLRYGSYSFDSDSVKLSFGLHTQLNEGGQPISQTQRVDVSGFLLAEGQAAVSTACSALQTALAVPFRDLKFLTDDGAETHVLLRNSTSLSGVVVVDGPKFTSSEGAEFVNQRKFEFSAEATYALPGTNKHLISFAETVVVWGGGPVFVVKPALRGPPQKQQLMEQAPWFATQSGQAVGFRDYPRQKVPAPIWGGHLIKRPEITEQTPKRQGNSYTHYPISWKYEFSSATALVGKPSLWIG